MADQLNNFNFTFVMRSAPQSGPTSSDAWNDSFTELANDLAGINSEWNKLVVLINGLPNGTLDTSVNVFSNGLDGKNIWVDQSVESSSDDLTYFNSTRNRPATVKEAFDDVYTSLATQINQARTDIVDQATGLTTDQKNRIGANIFDNNDSSTSTSLDGKSENNRLNLIQVASDVYGTTYSLDNDGSPNLSNSVRAMVDALLQLHNGSWPNDLAINHTGVVTVNQADVNSSAPGDDAYVGSPSDLEDDLDQLRTTLKTSKGTASWLSSHSALYVGGADSLEDLLTSTQGSAAKSASNPWGYQYDNVAGLVSILDAIRDFVGQDSYTDSTPDYTSTTFIDNGDSLEIALGKLDQAIITQSGIDVEHIAQLAALETFVGQDSNIDSSPSYSSSVYITNGDSLETAIGKLDAATVTESGVISTQLNTIRTFIGQDDTTDSTPTYSSTTYVANDDPLETAIGKLDSALSLYTFEELTDTPNDYTGHAGELLTVTSGENALQFNTEVTLDDDGNFDTTGGITADEDIEVTASGYGLVLKAPNGTRYRIQVDNAGNLQTTAL